MIAHALVAVSAHMGVSRALNYAFMRFPVRVNRLLCDKFPRLFGRFAFA